KKRVAILFASDDLYSSGLVKEFQREAKRLGAEVGGEKSFLKTENNFTTYLSGIWGRKPGAIYAPIYYAALGPRRRTAQGPGVSRGRLVGGDGWDSDALLNDAGEEMEGAYFTNHYAPDVPWPNSRIFVEKYKKRFGREPPGPAAEGYDAARLLADAIGRAK